MATTTSRPVISVERDVRVRLGRARRRCLERCPEATLGTRRVRELMGLTDVKLLIRFGRTPAKGRRVLAEMARHGLRRGERGLEVYAMCQISSNVILAREFAEQAEVCKCAGSGTWRL
jgi:hypothetical protein